MDILSYAIASKQSRRIKKFIANPDSNSGVITVPKTIELGQTITIPYGRVAILPDINIEGEIIIEGEVFIPSGGSYNQVDMICDNIKSKDKTYTVITKNLVDTVKDQDITGKKNFVNGLTTQGENITPYTGFKNLIINGCLSVWQRGTSWISANGPYMADRWFIDVNGAGTCSGSYYADDWIEGKYKVKTMAVTSGTLGSNPYIGFATVLEDMMRFAGKTLTLSFWAASDSTDPIYVFFGRNYSTGVTHSGSIAAGAGNPVLKKYTVTYKVPNYSSETYVSNNSYLQITIRQGRTIPGILRVGQIQLEEGSIATSFEQRPYPLELAMCQRYYEAYANGSVAIRSGNYVSNYINSTMIQFKVPKRVTPTVTIGIISLYSIGSALQSGFTFSPIVNGNLDFYITCNKVSHGLTDMVIATALSYTVSAEFN